MDAAIPKLRHDSYFPEWLLQRRRRAERALTTVVATCYLLGVSTRRMEKLVETLGILRLVLNGQSDAPVIVTQIRPFVIERDPPLRGWQFLPEQGAGVSVRFVEANLDCPEHPALLIVPNPQTGQIARRTASIDLQVSRSDVEVLEVTVYSTRSYVRWGLEVTYVSRGEVSTLRVTDPRLRLTGQAPGTLRTYTFFPDPSSVALPGAKGLVRTPQFDSTAEDLRYHARFNARLCR